eukprot:COSAG01_NODE_31275_length_600_cov_2.199601_1_plen_95_part_01
MQEAMCMLAATLLAACMLLLAGCCGMAGRAGRRRRQCDAQCQRRRRNAPPLHPVAGNGRRNGQLSTDTCANGYRYCWSLLPSQEYFSALFPWRLS